MQYHKRIVYGKLVDKTLSDIDYSELSGLAYGHNYSSDVARRMFYGSARTLQLMDLPEEANTSCATGDTVTNTLDNKIIELRKEKQKFYDQRIALNKLLRERSRQEELNEIITNCIREGMRNGSIPSLDYTPNTTIISSNDLVASLNDIHYGINIANAWCTYNPEICAQMMQRYMERIIQIAELHHSENCIISNCGDSISGKIHLTIQLANKENVIQQVQGVSELISRFLAELSSHFRTVRYISVSGNHSRLDTKDNSPIDERMDDLIEWYLKARLQNFENIIIDSSARIDPTVFVTEIRGKNYAGVHGDFDTSDSKIKSLNVMISNATSRPLYAILAGHRHCNTYTTNSGIKVIVSGSFVGIDDYCVQRRIYGNPEQTILICDENGIVCHYPIAL